MHAFTPTKLVKKTMIGRPTDFLGSDGIVYHGYIVSVQRGFAEVLYTVPCKAGEFRTLVKVREKRLEVY